MTLFHRHYHLIIQIIFKHQKQKIISVWNHLKRFEKRNSSNKTKKIVEYILANPKTCLWHSNNHWTSNEMYCYTIWAISKTYSTKFTNLRTNIIESRRENRRRNRRRNSLRSRLRQFIKKWRNRQISFCCSI